MGASFFPFYFFAGRNEKKGEVGENEK